MATSMPNSVPETGTYKFTNPYIQKYGNQTNMYDASGNFGAFSCPDKPTGPDFGPSSYGYNVDGGFTSGWVDLGGGAGGDPGGSLANIRQPANLVEFADAGDFSGTSTASAAADPGFNGGESPCNGYDTNGGANATGDCGPYNFHPDVWQEHWSCDWDFGIPGNGYDDWIPKNNSGRRPIPRHTSFVNCAFADGHVKAMRGSFMNAKLGTPDDILHNHD